MRGYAASPLPPHPDAALPRSTSPYRRGFPIASSLANASAGSASSAAARFSRRWASDEVPGISRMLGARRSSQASATCIGVAPSSAATADEGRGLQGREAAEREERHIGDALAGQLVDQRVVGAVGEIVVVLHADHRGDGPRLGDLGGGHVAEAQVADQALALQLGQRREPLARSSPRLGP